MLVVPTVLRVLEVEEKDRKASTSTRGPAVNSTSHHRKNGCALLIHCAPRWFGSYVGCLSLLLPFVSASFSITMSLSDYAGRSPVPLLLFVIKDLGFRQKDLYHDSKVRDSLRFPFEWCAQYYLKRSSEKMKHDSCCADRVAAAPRCASTGAGRKQGP